MMYTEFDEQVFIRRTKEIAFEEGETVGLEKGESKGKEKQLISMVCKKLSKDKSPETIADELEEELDLINSICEAAKPFAPDYDVDAIYDAIHAADVTTS